MDLDQKWSLFKKYICDELEPEEYQGWLEALQLIDLASGRAVIAGIPHPVFQFDIKKNYDSLIRRILGEIFPEHAPFNKKHIEYQIGKHHVPKKTVIQAEFSFDPIPTPPSQPVANPASQKTSINVKTVPPSSTSNNSNIIRFSGTPLFDPKFTLDSLIVGKNNRLAYKAGCLASQTPGIAYNPFIVYGPLGVGKTHLLEGIGQAIQKNHPKLKTIYTPAESFLNDFITHLKSQRMPVFRKRYREIDVFLLDDLQILAGAKQCQEELLNTINTLRQQEKQIIITSNQLPREIKTLDPSLRSRLESGLIADIDLPDLETRMSILESKALRQHIRLPVEVCQFMAQHIHSDVHKLEGALTRLGAYASLLCEEISLEFAKTTLEDFLEHVPKSYPKGSYSSVYTEQIIQKACSMFQVLQEDLLSKRRDNRTVKARNISIFLLKELTQLSLKQIGEKLNRSHSAVHNSLKQVRKQMEKDAFFQKQVMTFLQELSQNQLPMPEVSTQKKFS